MVGSGHTRRLATIVLAAVFILATSGCYFGSSDVDVGPNQGLLWCPDGVDLGPGHIASGPGVGYPGFWKPAPTAVTIEFAVVSSDSTDSITALAFDGPAGSFGVVWDGTRSTGTKSIPWDRSGLSYFVPSVTTSGAAHVNWWIMAQDSAGNEVGFTCVPFTVFGSW